MRAAVSLDNGKLLAQKEEEKMGEVLENIDSLMQQAYPNGFSAACINYIDRGNDQLMEINYTSGTTGFSKGVMLTGNNLAGNIVYGINSQLHRRGTRCVSFLPLAHAYGCAFDMLTPLPWDRTSPFWAASQLPRCLLRPCKR